MELTDAQQRLVDRAHQHSMPEEVYVRLAARRPEAHDLDITLLSGSADFRVAYRLKEKGLGRIVCFSPVEGQFYKHGS